jgi:hypothetical protein
VRVAIVATLFAIGCGGSGGSSPIDGNGILDLALRSDGAIPHPDLGGSTDMAQGGISLFDALSVITTNCSVASQGRYATDEGGPAIIDICKLIGGFYWHADMDIDCDGQMTAQCNLNADPDYQNQTSFTQSDGKPLIASQLPYVVVPLPSSRFDYMASDIQPGAVAIVLYNGQVAYGVFGDEGPADIIGEASYAMAKGLGIDPDPSTGGVDSGVTYILFTGKGAVVDPIEDPAAAAALGHMLALQLIVSN